MKKSIIFLIPFIISYSVIAQSKKNIALFQIQDLKQSALLVRLSTSENQLELLRKMKNMDRYHEVKKAQEEENQKIIAAFTAEFNFAPKVYFFASSNSDKIKAGDLSQVLLNKNLAVIDTFPFKTYYIAEFSNTEEMDIPAVIIKDANFKQLDEPFPFFTRTYETLPIVSRSHMRTVELMNQKLNAYYWQATNY